MRLDNRFGDFLLFRKLGTSPLGTTFRAGRLQARAIDRVVLLQRFDGAAIDRRRLAEDAASRAGIVEALGSPRFAHGLGLGVEDGVPWVAYDYLLGRTLQETLGRAAQAGRSPAASYLVALVEQAAAGLAAASQVRLDGIPVRHGFVVPELLLLSAEGRVYALGFAHGPALLRQEPLRELFAPYLAPEARADDSSPGDDVYSLAAILFEGLTGAPPDPTENTARQVDQSLLTVAGEALAPAVQDLLKSGLAPAGARPDLKTFHRALRRVVKTTEGSPSQFQLAFFLHQLFRDELEAEAVEMRGEKTARFDPLLLTSVGDEDRTLSVPTSATGPAPVPGSPPPGAAAAGGESAAVGAADPAARPSVVAVAARASEPRFLQRSFLSGVAVALALAVALTAILHLGRAAPAPAADRDDARSAPDAGAAPAAASPTADLETHAEVRRLVAAGAADLRLRLENEYQPRLDQLRSEIRAAHEARQGDRARRAAAAPAPSPAEPLAARPPEIPAAAEPVVPDRAVAEPTAPAAGVDPSAADDAGEAGGGGEGPLAAVAGNPPAPGHPGVASPAAESPVEAVGPRPSSAPPSAAAAGPDERDGEAPAGAEGAQSPPAPTAAAEQAAAPTDPGGEPAAAADDAYSPPRLLAPPQPRYPPVAQRLRKTARVQVRVRVGADGRVGESELVSDPAGFGFDKAAIEAATKTRWRPAERGGVATTAWAVLTIDFRL